MTAKWETQPAGRGATTRRRADTSNRATRRRAADAPPRERRSGRSAPQTTPKPRRTPPKSASQAKARAKARKAKAPKVVRPPLRERLIARLSEVDLSPRTLAAKVPFVVLVIGSLGVGLGLTLWLSTDSAERSYELGNARETNRVLSQQKEALERDVLDAQSAPALAEAARNLGMIPSRDTAHLVQDPAGNWVVVGTPRPAEGVPPPPLNTPLPEVKPAPPPPVQVDPREALVRVPTPSAAGRPLTAGATPPVAGPEVLVRTPAPAAVGAPAPLDQHAATPGAVSPGPLVPDASPPSAQGGAPQLANEPAPINSPAPPAAGDLTSVPLQNPSPPT